MARAVSPGWHCSTSMVSAVGWVGGVGGKELECERLCKRSNAGLGGGLVLPEEDPKATPRWFEQHSRPSATPTCVQLEEVQHLPPRDVKDSNDEVRDRHNQPVRRQAPGMHAEFELEFAAPASLRPSPPLSIHLTTLHSPLVVGSPRQLVDRGGGGRAAPPARLLCRLWVGQHGKRDLLLPALQPLAPAPRPAPHLQSRSKQWCTRCLAGVQQEEEEGC